MKTLNKIAAATLVLLATQAQAQSAADLLENGIAVRDGQKIYFQWDEKSFSSDVSKRGANLLPASDSPLYLTRKTGIQVWVHPLNPLNYSIKTKLNFTVDNIDDAAAQALGSIIDALQIISSANKGIIKNKALTEIKKGGKGLDGFFGSVLAQQANGTDKCTEALNKAVATAQQLDALLRDSKQTEINQIFLQLKALDFKAQTAVKGPIDQAKLDRNSLKTSHFDKVDAAFKDFLTAIAAFDCKTGRDELDRFTMTIMAERFRAAIDNQAKRLHNLDNAIKLVEAEYNGATYVTASGEWYKKLETAQLKPGQGTVYVLTIYTDGIEIKDGELVKIDPKEVANYYYRVQRFRRIVPEVAAGIAYADLTFPKYTTEPDASGQQLIVTAGEEVFKKVNVTSMLNFNYYLPAVPIHPFLQIGIGANADYPTLFTGIGIRSNIKPISRIAISIGYASTWIKTLNTLQVGSIVKGDADLQKDITYEFHWPLRPYIGIQFNF